LVSEVKLQSVGSRTVCSSHASYFMTDHRDEPPCGEATHLAADQGQNVGLVNAEKGRRPVLASLSAGPRLLIWPAFRIGG
jgi:hypothetical protein